MDGPLAVSSAKRETASCPGLRTGQEGPSICERPSGNHRPARVSALDWRGADPSLAQGRIAPAVCHRFPATAAFQWLRSSTPSRPRASTSVWSSRSLAGGANGYGARRGNIIAIGTRRHAWIDRRWLSPLRGCSGQAQGRSSCRQGDWPVLPRPGPLPGIRSGP
jgi:hypothetical protein